VKSIKCFWFLYITVLPDKYNVKYVKRNDIRLKAGKSEEFNKLLLQFLGSLEGKVKGLKGFVVMNDTTDENAMMVLTLWESEYDMEVFYHPSNRAFSGFVDRASPLFESKPERTDYEVSSFRI
jgi:heme-degrading monooxygenase HmoA